MAPVPVVGPAGGARNRATRSGEARILKSERDPAFSAAAVTIIRRTKSVPKFPEQSATSPDKAISFHDVGMRRSWVDEAYLDLSARCQAEDADASLILCVPIARELKERIRSERGLTATIGIASNKLLAKIGSDFEKPDGLTLVSERDKVQFLRPLPTRVLYGVGRVTEKVLLAAGL